MGRPSKYTPALGDKICSQIIDGVGLREICAEVGISIPTIFYWIQHNERFSKHYARARQIQAEILADELKTIADEKPVCLIPTKSGGSFEATDKSGIERNRLRVDTRKWIASKLLPKKYGDKLEVEHSGEIGIAERIARIRERKLNAESGRGTT
jgi:AcrR family transcriptional regulator